jgi:hypothetical protein
MVSLISTRVQRTSTDIRITGFAVVGEYQDEAIKQAQKQAFEVVLEWLKAH